MGCPHCEAGLPAFKLKRQYVHRVGWKTVICADKGIRLDQVVWEGDPPVLWEPRRVRKLRRKE